ncbi:MAG TPA: YbhB/YbcL family Raf kinase inhibitor-like protein [Vicinamibacterales bacterium]|nr:YbhB/YbcL family Raf kinase inhibitor-like protein [Vicinamibacterales bacterium]
MTVRFDWCLVALAVAAALRPVSLPAQSVVPTLTVTSPTLKEGQPVPRQHTPDGRNDSPAISWAGVPAAAKSLMVFCEDPGVGNPPPFVHWVVYNIPATASGLPEAMPIDPSAAMPAGLAGAVQGTSGFRRAIYRGPAPPPGRRHSYHFVVYALDMTVTQPPNTPPLTRAELLDATRGHVVGRGELVATYQRN